MVREMQMRRRSVTAEGSRKVLRPTSAGGRFGADDASRFILRRLAGVEVVG